MVSKKLFLGKHFCKIKVNRWKILIVKILIKRQEFMLSLVDPDNVTLAQEIQVRLQEAWGAS